MIYQKIPEFDEQTQYVVQLEPITKDGEIYVGCEVRELNQVDEPMTEHIPVDDVAPMPEPTEHERLVALEQAMLEMMGVVL